LAANNARTGERREGGEIMATKKAAKKTAKKAAKKK
jgi:hypothetical protein